MANTQIAPVATVKGLLTDVNYKKRFEEILGKKAQGFMSSIINVSNLSGLKDADPKSIIASAVIAATMDLPIDPNLGFAWIVPFNVKEGTKYVKKAQFQMATRGYVQLAQRTGQYLKLNAVYVYPNQYKSYNALTEELDADFSVDGEGDPIGYAVYFKLMNGYEKLVYWPKKKAMAHGKRYSKSFNNGPWQTHTDEMCMKTVLKDTLRKWGVLSLDFQRGIEADQAIVKNDVAFGADITTESFDYADNPANDIIDAEYTATNNNDNLAEEFKQVKLGDEAK